jgi:hypothetical protein
MGINCNKAAVFYCNVLNKKIRKGTDENNEDMIRVIDVQTDIRSCEIQATK